MLSITITSHSTRSLFADWSASVPHFQHVVYDAVSFSALRQATHACFGTAGVPHYRFDRATTIVGIEADFLGTWLSPVEFTRQYATRRKGGLAGGRLQHYQFEAGVSLTGSNADRHVLMVYGVNPVYDFPDAQRFARGMESVALTISFADRVDETAIRSHALCPDHHFLEAWGDAEPVSGSFSLAQPTIAPLFNTRAAQESLLKWLGESPDFYSYVRAVWRRELYARQDRYHTFDEFWDHSLHDGVF